MRGKLPTILARPTCTASTFVATLLCKAMTSWRARAGSVLVALSYALSAFAAYAILNTQPDISTRTTRHLVAGALAIVSLSAVEILIALFPLRWGELWAFWVTHHRTNAGVLYRLSHKPVNLRRSVILRSLASQYGMVHESPGVKRGPFALAFWDLYCCLAEKRNR